MSKGFVLPSLGMSLLILGMLTIAGLSLTVYVYSLRLEACEAKYDKFVSETRRVGEEQKAKTEATVTKQKGATDSVRKDYRAALTELNRLRSGTSRNHVPTPSNGAEGVDDTTGEFRAHCAADALKLSYLQEFIRKQGFPIE